MHRALALIMLVLFGVSTAQAVADPKSSFFTASDGVKIHYLTLGNKGSWVVLIHGYTSSANRWIQTGIAAALAKNHRVVALDNRNHGLSDKPEPNGFGKFQDVIELMDHLKIAKAHLHGYSMGGGMVAHIMATSPDRIITASFGGSGIGEVDDKLRASAAALDAPMPEPQPSEANAFKEVRDRTTARADAAGTTVAAIPRPVFTIDLKTIKFPVFAINGEYDRPYSKTQRLWRELANFQNVILPKKNHMSTILTGGLEYIEPLTKFINANDAN